MARRPARCYRYCKNKVRWNYNSACGRREGNGHIGVVAVGRWDCRQPDLLPKAAMSGGGIACDC